MQREEAHREKHSRAKGLWRKKVDTAKEQEIRR
jgi:hypothetical protein